MSIARPSQEQESIFKLIDALFRGHLLPEEVEPLCVFKHVGATAGSWLA